MGRGEKEADEAVSPTGRFFLLPKTDQVIDCILGFENEIDIEARKAEFQRTLLQFHPRLSCLLTVNDVLVGVVASGLDKYFKMKSLNDSRNDLRITALSLVNIRKAPGLKEFFQTIKDGRSQWGNRVGYVLLPIKLGNNGHDPFEYICQGKRILDLKKESLEARFSYRAGALTLSILGLEAATTINYRIFCNTSFTLSNIVGPSEKVMFAKNPLSYIRATSTSLPHALTIHMISYNGNIDMQLLVAKDIIQEPETLAKCMEDAFMEIKRSTISQS